jgi:UDP-galactopyranose mutase
VTSITYEFPQAEGDPYYPIPRAENAALFKRYEALALGTPNVTFVGRLATYRYYNMDQVVGQALSAYRRIRAKHGDTASGDAADASSDGRSRQGSPVSQGAQTTAAAK